MARQDDLSAALAAVIRDHGRVVFHDARRFRASLSDVLGARADDLRGQIDALAICVDEGIPARIREARRDDLPSLRPQWVEALQQWGLTAERAGWAVDLWAAAVPPTTEPVLSTDPDPEPPAPAFTALPAEPPPPESLADEVLPATAQQQEDDEPGPDEPGPEPGPDERDGEDPTPDRAAEDQTTEYQATPAGPGAAAGEKPGASRRRRLLVAAGAVVVVAAGGIVVATTADDGDEPSPPRLAADAVVATTAESVAPAGAPQAAMAAPTGGVRLDGLDSVDHVTTADGTFGAPAGGELIGFSVADWPCDRGRTCVPWQRLGLTVAVGDDARPLPYGSRTWRAVAKGTFREADYASIRTAPTRRTAYRYGFASTGVFLGSTSETMWVNVVARLSAKVRDHTLKQGQRLQVTGAVAPATRGMKVSLQRKSGKRWKTIATARTNSRGAYKLSVKTKSSGRWTVRVVLSSGSGLIGRTSGGLGTVKIARKKAPRPVVTDRAAHVDYVVAKPAPIRRPAPPPRRSASARAAASGPASSSPVSSSPVSSSPVSNSPVSATRIPALDTATARGVTSAPGAGATTRPAPGGDPIG